MYRAQIIGNLTDDPKSSQKDDMIFCNFAVAHSNRATGKTEYLNIVALNKLATICLEYLSKGSQVFVSVDTAPKVSTWMDKDGNPKASVKYLAREVEFLNSNQKQEQVS